MAESGDGGKQTTFSGTTCHPHPEADTKDAECCGCGQILWGGETAALRPNLFASPSPTLLENPSLGSSGQTPEGSFCTVGDKD